MYCNSLQINYGSRDSGLQWLQAMHVFFSRRYFISWFNPQMYNVKAFPHNVCVWRLYDLLVRVRVKRYWQCSFNKVESHDFGRVTWDRMRSAKMSGCDLFQAKWGSQFSFRKRDQTIVVMRSNRLWRFSGLVQVWKQFILYLTYVTMRLIYFNSPQTHFICIRECSTMEPSSEVPLCSRTLFHTETDTRWDLHRLGTVILQRFGQGCVGVTVVYALSNALALHFSQLSRASATLL